MKNRSLILALIVAGLAGGYGLYRFGVNQGAKLPTPLPTAKSPQSARRQTRSRCIGKTR